MKLNALKTDVSRSLTPFVAVAAVAVLFACGNPSEQAAELLAGSREQSGAVLYDAENAAAGDADIRDADPGDAAVDGEIDDDAIGDDAVEVGDDAVDNDAGRDAGVGVGDNGGVGVVGEAAGDDAGDVGGAGVVGEAPVVVDDGGGGLLVVGVCGWPGLLCPADESVAPIDEGGPLWQGPTMGSPNWQWKAWVGRVLDLCDAHEALAVIDGRYWANRGGIYGDGGIDYGDGGIDYDAEISFPDMERVRRHRRHEAVACNPAEAAVPVWTCLDGIDELEAYLAQFVIEPRPSEVLAWLESQGRSDCFDATTLGHRYVYVTVGGPSNPKVSVEAAVEEYRQAIEFWANHPSDFSHGDRLGYWGDSYAVESPQDGLVVLSSSVSVIDGVVRGLAQNHSERLWARNVAVTATDPAGVEHTWRFPLAVQPGEPVPFEIEGWTGSQSPSEIALTISAEMSPTIDLTRSLALTWFRYYRTVEELLEFFPEVMVGSEIPGGQYHFVEVRIQREAPTAQARLAQAAREQPIENLVVYGATLNGGVVSDVFELTPMVSVYFDEPEPEWIEVSSIGVELPDIGPIGTAIVGALLRDHDEPLIWAGGAVRAASPRGRFDHSSTMEAT